MNQKEFHTLCAFIAANWPAAAMTESTLDVYEHEIIEFDGNLVLAVIRSEYADADFPPPPMKLRASVVRASMPRLPDADEVYNEVMTKVAAVGYVSEEPAWSHPAIGRLIEGRGGWRSVCEQTPARSAFDGQSIGAAGTFKAQLRDDWRMLAARYQAEQRPALSAPAVAALDREAGQ